MKADHREQQALQRAYYAQTAQRYDQQHNHEIDEHQFALAFLRGVIDLFDIRSVLDIGSGTGRALLTLKAAKPDLRVVGIEPSAELREQGHAKGLGRDELVDGDAHHLAYADGAFDMVTEFATLHHVPDPNRVVGEMLRVASTAVFISDSNNFGQGSAPMRSFKRLLRSAGLWRAFDHVRTRGKGYHVSEGDGLFYSYSVFDQYAQIDRACESVHLLNTKKAGIDPFKSASAVALLGLKKALLGSS
jgi:ubiquinone/menaquinone biosynthesis C-methylase UbiE